MERLTFDGDFCDISMYQFAPGGSFCEDRDCSQRRVWERLKQYKDTGLDPKEIDAVAAMDSENCAKTADAIDRLLAGEKMAKTRGDRIRAMSDEELATDLLRMFEELCEDGIPSPEYMRFWLQQTAEEGDRNG